MEKYKTDARSSTETTEQRAVQYNESSTRTANQLSMQAANSTKTHFIKHSSCSSQENSKLELQFSFGVAVLIENRS